MKAVDLSKVDYELGCMKTTWSDSTVEIALSMWIGLSLCCHET